MKKYILGFVFGAIVCLLIYVATTFFVEPLKGRFSFAYPAVAGKYVSFYPDLHDRTPELINVNQLGFKIYGDYYSPDERVQYDLTGNVTSSGLISYQFSPKDKLLNDHGTALIKLDRKGDSGEGYVLFFSEKSERTQPIRIIVKRAAEK